MKKVIKGLHSGITEKLERGPRASVSVEVSGVVGRKVLDAKDKAGQIIDEAEADAARIREEASGILKEVEAVREQARQEGFQVGQEEGFSQTTELAMKLEQLKEQFYANAESDIVALVMEIAEKVIGKIVHDNPDAIVAVVGQAIESSLGDRLTIRVNPADFPRVQSQLENLRDGVDKTKRLVIKEDDSISQGGCIVETEVGMIDAQLETQLKAIRKALEL